MEKNYDVIVSGLFFCDLIFTGLTELPRLGAEVYGTGFDIVPGGMFNIVASLRRMGLSVGWKVTFGNDLFSRFLLQESFREGLDETLYEHVDFPRRVVTASFSMPSDRGFISFVEPGEEADEYELIKDSRARCFMTCAKWFNPRIGEIKAGILQGRGLYILDPQFTDLTLNSPGVIETLHAVDVFLPNESEAIQLTGASDCEHALDILCNYTNMVVIKRGAKGAIAQDQKRRATVSAIPVNVIDTTGAGDCFNAGFIAAILQGEPLDTCLLYGNICGGLSTTARGVGAAPTIHQVQEYIQKMGQSG